MAGVFRRAVSRMSVRRRLFSLRRDMRQIVRHDFDLAPDQALDGAEIWPLAAVAEGERGAPLPARAVRPMRCT